MESKRLINVEKLNSRVKNYENIKKPYFTLDIDNLDWINILYTYANLFAHFLEDETQFKEELKMNKLFRVYYSSSKSGVHIKCNIENNVAENLFYRALFRDDIHRFRLDYLRLNRDEKSFCYDVAFKSKTKKGVLMKKEWVLQNPLEKVGMKKRTFYKLIKYLKMSHKTKIDLILNSHKVVSSNYKSIYGELKKGRELDMNEQVISDLNRLLIKYKAVNQDKEVYETKYPLELAKAIYRMAKLGK